MRRLGAATALTVGLLVAASTTGLAASLTLVSGPTPFDTPSCLALNSIQTGRNYLNAKVEPQVAVNPRDPKNLIGTWQQDRWSNGGAHGLVAGFSRDGGQTWSETPLPFSDCAGPDALQFQRASDPWVSIGPDGIAYASGLVFDHTTGRSGVSSATSTNGGRTWGKVQLVSFSPTNQVGPDKNSVTADPVKPGVAYTVWDNLILPTDQPDDNPHPAAYSGPTLFSKTTDGGQTWSQAQVIVNTENRQQTIGNVVVVDPGSGALYDFFDLILQPNPGALQQISNTNVAFVKSTDGGATWSPPQVIAPLQSVGVVDPNTGQPIRTGDIIPEATIDPASGQLYAVWQQASTFKRETSPFDDEVVLSTSKNGGATWSAPARVSTFSGLPAFTATPAVGSGGTVAITYYDFRNLTSTNTTSLPTDYWITFSKDGGVTFGNEEHISGPFNMLSAPFARGFFVGDYEALQSVGSSFQPFFVQTNCTSFNPGTGGFDPTDPACAPASSTATATSNTNPTDVFTASIPAP